MKCPHCGADHTHLTLDIDIRVTCSVDENGKHILKPYWDYDSVNEAVQGISEEDVHIYCEECGWDNQAVEFMYDEEGNYIGLKEKEE